MQSDSGRLFGSSSNSQQACSEHCGLHSQDFVLAEHHDGLEPVEEPLVEEAGHDVDGGLGDSGAGTASTSRDGDRSVDEDEDFEGRWGLLNRGSAKS
jgi:hypothetical protein